MLLALQSSNSMTVVTICLPHYTVGSTSSRAMYFGSLSPQLSPRGQQCELKTEYCLRPEGKWRIWGSGSPLPRHWLFPPCQVCICTSGCREAGGRAGQKARQDREFSLKVIGGERLTSSCVWYIKDSQRIQSHPSQALGPHIHPVKAPEVDCPLWIPHKHRAKQ